MDERDAVFRACVGGGVGGADWGLPRVREVAFGSQGASAHAGGDFDLSARGQRPGEDNRAAGADRRRMSAGVGVVRGLTATDNVV